MGARKTDLSAEILDMIYIGIKHEIGQNAATEFVKMIQCMRILPTIAFLHNLYQLESNNWILAEEAISYRLVDFGPLDENAKLVIFCTGMAWVAKGCDETNLIKIPFLEKHQEELQTTLSTYDFPAYNKTKKMK